MYYGDVYDNKQLRIVRRSGLSQCFCVSFAECRVETKKELNASIIGQIFPWDRLPDNSPKNMKFGIKAGS